MQIPAHASLVPREYNIFIWKYQRKYDTMGKLYQIPSGEVAEWSKAPVSKTGRGETSSRVRISPSPQNDTSSADNGTDGITDADRGGIIFRRVATKSDGTETAKVAHLSRISGFVPIFCTNDLIEW